MKNILKIAFVGLFSLILLSSCMKEVMPTDRATSDQVSESESGLLGLVNSLPAAFVQGGNVFHGTGPRPTSAWHGDFSYPSTLICLDNLTGDIFDLNGVGYDHYTNWLMNKSLNEDGEGILFWANYYGWIKTCHSIMLAVDPATSSDVLKNALATAYGYRAFCYLDLARVFEFKENSYTQAANIIGMTIPIVIETTTEAEAKNNPRAKASDVYAMILSDIETAESFIVNSLTNKYSITAGLLEGLRARTYMQMGADGDATAYAKAALAARAAITKSSSSALTEDQWQDPKSGFNSATSNNSWIFGVAQTTESIPSGIVNFTSMMSTEGAGGYGAIQTGGGVIAPRGMNKELFDKINLKDFRRFSWKAPGDASTDYNLNRTDPIFWEKLPNYGSLKFRPNQGNALNGEIGNVTNVPIMRMEEMLFIEMEATAHSNISGAKALLKSFMDLRVLDGSYSVDAIGSLDQFVAEMMIQKRIEFWGEGIIMYDMKRLGYSTTRGYSGTNALSNARFNTTGVASYWNLVIPREEAQNNTAIINSPDPTESIPLWVE